MERQETWSTLHRVVEEEMLEWRRGHPKATLREIENEVDEQLAKVRRQWVQDVAQASTTAMLGGAGERPVCPQCGGPVQAEGQHTRRLKTTHEHEVHLQRSYAHCPTCEVGFFPPG